MAGQEIRFGTSGHRGSALERSFNESHVLAIAQAVCDFRRRRDIDRPLFLGVDTHTLSAPAQASALAVFAANGVEVMLAQNDEYTSGGAVVEPALPRHADPSTSTTAAVGARRKPAR